MHRIYLNAIYLCRMTFLTFNKDAWKTVHTTSGLHYVFSLPYKSLCTKPGHFVCSWYTCSEYLELGTCITKAHSTSHVMLWICNPGLTKFSVISGIQMSVTLLSISLANSQTPSVTPMLLVKRDKSRRCREDWVQTQLSSNLAALGRGYAAGSSWMKILAHMGV